MALSKKEIEQKTGFHPDQVYMIMDYETYSEADLKSIGAYEYARHKTTEIICIAWRLGTRAELQKQLERGTPAKGYIPDLEDSQPDFSEFFRSIMHPRVILVAHNALFEQVITRFVFGHKLMYSERETLGSIPHSRWICTASLAATLAVPRGLEGAANALELEIKKDMEGAKLLKKMMRPAKPTKKDNNPRRHRDDPDNVNRLLEYCKTDVDAETALFLKAPALKKSERDLWLLDQEINFRGFRVDRPLIKLIRKLIRVEIEELDREAHELSGGVASSARERDNVLTWLDCQGLFLGNLQRKTVEDLLASDLSEVTSRTRDGVRRMLELREAVSKSSTAKYPKILASSKTDGRVRDTLVFFAASTGRWGGGRVNPQNFTRPHIKNFALLAVLDEIIRGGDDHIGTLDWLRLADGNPMAVFASLLRSMIIPANGKRLHVADFNAIEARVLFWLARHEKGLKAFRNGEPMYEQLAAAIFGMKLKEIGKESLERFIGKTAQLGCGYAMGSTKFQGTCEAQGRPISKAVADKAVQTFRRENKPVVDFWRELEEAAIAAVEQKGKKFTVGYLEWYCWKEFLCCKLPSGRCLYYLKPQVGFDLTPYGSKKKTLFYLGVDKTKKKMVREKTYGGKLAENVTQAVSRDIMANSMLNLRDAGAWDIILSVHDEILAECSAFDSATYEDYIKVMERPPRWGLDIPLKVAGYEAMRYRK